MRSETHREIAHLITQNRRFCTAAVNRRLSLVGHSLHQYTVLFRLSREDEAPQHELAFDAGLDPAAVSRLVREMVAAGLVTTRVDPRDKRQRFVRLTAKGRDLERTLAPIVDDALTPYMKGLSVAEERQFLELLRKANAAMVAAALEAERQDAKPVRPVDNGRPRRRA